MHLRCIRTPSPYLWVKQQGSIVGAVGQGCLQGRAQCCMLLAWAEQRLQDKVCILTFSPGCLSASGWVALQLLGVYKTKMSMYFSLLLCVPCKGTARCRGRAPVWLPELLPYCTASALPPDPTLTTCADPGVPLYGMQNNSQGYQVLLGLPWVEGIAWCRACAERWEDMSFECVIYGINYGAN